MTFYVLEIQTSEQSGAIIPFAYQNQPDADEKFYDIMKYAVKSQVPKHGAIILDDNLSLVKSGMYRHEVPVNKPSEPSEQEEKKEESES